MYAVKEKGGKVQEKVDQPRLPGLEKLRVIHGVILRSFLRQCHADLPSFRTVRLCFRCREAEAQNFGLGAHLEVTNR